MLLVAQWGLGQVCAEGTGVYLSQIPLHFPISFASVTCKEEHGGQTMTVLGRLLCVEHVEEQNKPVLYLVILSPASCWFLV
jgi:hypothetical protein